MFGLSWTVISLFGISLAGQLVGLSLLSKTEGLSNIPYSLAVLLAYAIGLGALARLIYLGMNISVLIPIMATVIPFATIAIGFLFYNESASPTKIGLLLAACGLIGFASKY